MGLFGFVKKIEENNEVKQESNNKKVIIKDIDNEKQKQLFDAMREKLKYFIKIFSICSGFYIFIRV